MGNNTNTNTNTNKNEIYEVNPFILNSSMGYSAQIDGESIMVVANLYGEGFNRNNEKIRLIKEEGFVLINGERTPTGKFESINDNQLYQLVTAGVILLNDKQRNDFRNKFFSRDSKINSSRQTEKKNSR